MIHAKHVNISWGCKISRWVGSQVSPFPTPASYVFLSSILPLLWTFWLLLGHAAHVNKLTADDVLIVGCDSDWSRSCQLCPDSSNPDFPTSPLISLIFLMSLALPSTFHPSKLRLFAWRRLSDLKLQSFWLYCDFWLMLGNFHFQ